MDDEAIRRHCRPLYSNTGKPSIPPEKLFPALLGGYLLGITSERRLVMELQCNMALRWFLGLNLDQDAWDHSTFSQNRRRRFDKDATMEWFFDQTIRRALDEGLLSRHVSADGRLVRANASYKSFVPIELAMHQDEYKQRLRSQDEDDEEGPQDPGNRAVDFRGEKRSNQTHRSTTDPDCRMVSKGSSGKGACPGDTVDAVMESRNRILRGFSEEIFRASTSEEQCGRIRNAVAYRTYSPTPYLALMTSWSFAVSTYCWNLATLPSLTSQTWQTCVSMLFPVALYLPL